MIQIKFITQGANAAFGAFSPGDTARVSETLAKHFVNDCKCAKYLEVPEKVETKMAEAPVLTVKKSKK